MQPGDGAANSGNKPAAPNTQIITFPNAVVYAASTHYDFTKENDKQVNVRVLALPEEATVTMPGDLLENGGLHGPSGVNSAMVRKSFLLIKNDKGEVTEVKAVE